MFLPILAATEKMQHERQSYQSPCYAGEGGMDGQAQLAGDDEGAGMGQSHWEVVRRKLPMYESEKVVFYWLSLLDAVLTLGICSTLCLKTSTPLETITTSWMTCVS